MRGGPFSDRALIALWHASPLALTDREVARTMQLGSSASVMADLEARQLVRSSVGDRTRGPGAAYCCWTLLYQLTPAGYREARRAIHDAARERSAFEQRLAEADR